MSAKLLPLAVLVAALAGLGGSIAWAVSEVAGDSTDTLPRSAWPMMGLAPSGRATPVGGLAEAKARAQRFADALGLRADEVMRFQRNYYVELVDGQGRGATEVLVDPATGTVSLEYGPAMMWNTRYGMMSGRWGWMGDMRSMMGSAWGGMTPAPGSGMMGSMMGAGMMGPFLPDSSGTLSGEEARRVAERWLQELDPALHAGEPEAFPGYYTFHALRRGRIEGMLSVHATAGAVLYHWWHGRFISMME